VALAGAVMLGACGGSAAPGPAASATGSAGPTVAATPAPLKPVTFRAEIGFNGKHVPFLAGIVEGIYKKHGLDVTAKEGTGSATIVQTVGNGSDDFGFVDGAVLTQTAAKGLPVKMVVGVLQTAGMVVVATPQSGITKVADFNGKTGAFANGVSIENLFPAFAAKNGIKMDSITRVAVDAPTRDTMVVTGKVDFGFNLLNSVPTMEARCSCKLTVFKYSDYGVDTVGNGIVTTDTMIRDRPDLVKAFAAATVEAIDFAVKNPTQAVDDFFKYATSTQFTKPTITEQWKIASTFLHTPATATKPIGCMATSDWQQTIDFMTQYGGVAAGSMTPPKAFTNDYLPTKC
jgi:NitT/TauT family transport system substrate-binding protein